MKTNYLLGCVLVASLAGCGSLPHSDRPMVYAEEATGPAYQDHTPKVYDYSDYSWAERDTIAQTAYYVMHGADWRTTMDIARHPNVFEGNPILGKHPSNGRINIYFLGTAIMHYTISEALPAEIRPAWQWGTFFMELYYVLGNMAAGLAIF